MALEIREAGQRFGISILIPEAFTQNNLDPMYPPNDCLDPNLPSLGVLGGSVAGLYGDLLVGKADASHRPVGLFIEDATGPGLVGNPPAGSGILVYVKGMGTYEVDVFETRSVDRTTELVYVAGDSLYVSSRGFLTKEPTSGYQTEVLGVVVKAPVASNPVMVLDLRI